MKSTSINRLGVPLSTPGADEFILQIHLKEPGFVYTTSESFKTSQKKNFIERN